MKTKGTELLYEITDGAGSGKALDAGTVPSVLEYALVTVPVLILLSCPAKEPESEFNDVITEELAVLCTKAIQCHPSCKVTLVVISLIPVLSIATVPASNAKSPGEPFYPHISPILPQRMLSQR